MLKSFHVNGKFEAILPHLSSQPNQSHYICSLIMADMNRTSEMQLIKDALREVMRETSYQPQEPPKTVQKTQGLRNVNLDI